MINLSFAPNENLPTGLRATGLLLQPWRYLDPQPLNQTKQVLSELTQLPHDQVFLLLSARSALKTLLESLALPPKSEVLVQAFTCEAVVLPALDLGLQPIYADVETQSYSFDLKSFKARLSDKTKAVILQHTFGMTPKHRQAVMDICQERKLILIEDLAHGFHLELFEASQSYPTIKLFSFGRSKLVSSTYGGAIAIPQPQLAEKFAAVYRQLSYPSHWLIAKALLYKAVTPLIRATQGTIISKLIHKGFVMSGLFTTEVSRREKAGYYDGWLEKKYPGILAASLNPELANYRDLITRNTEIAQLYAAELPDQGLSSHPVLRYPLLVAQPQKLLKNLRQRNIILGDWYRQPVDPKQLDQSKVDYQMGSCPIAEDLGSQVINLPLNIDLTSAQNVIKALKAHHV